MSLIALAASAGRPSRTVRRLFVVAAALAGAALVLGLIGLIVVGATSAPAPKNPFGTGIREAAPSATGLGGWLLAVQSEFHRTLVAALAAIRRNDGTAWSLVLFGFAYGIFHAAGPGHGKGVIASYIVASRKTLWRGLALSTGAAVLQGVVAIVLVGTLTVAFQAGAPTLNAAANAVELASFAGLAAFGSILVWRRSAAIVDAGSAHGAACDEGCGHLHAVTATDAARATTLREGAAVIAAAGLRPCSGAIILLVYALSQGLFAIGVATVAAMAAGTALTTGALAALAVGAKGLALRLAAGHGSRGGRAVAWLELGAAAFAAALGAALLLGLSQAGAAS